MIDYGAGGVEGYLDEWDALIQRRVDVAERFDAQYIHLVVPEKLTALRRWAPVPVAGPMPPMAAFLDRFRDEGWFVDAHDLLSRWQHPDEPYLTTSSHFSARGAQKVVGAIAERVAAKVVSLIENVPLREISHVQGDLALLMQLPFYSRALRPETHLMQRYAIGLREVAQSADDSYGKVGRVVHWSNTTAPSKLKIQVFGGSMSGEGDSPEQLSWWLKHFFAEVRLDWRPDVDPAILDDWRPDVVIAQAIERDITAIPQR